MNIMAEGVETTLIGLSMVFFVLIIIMLVLMLMEKIFHKPEMKHKTVINLTPEPSKIDEPVDSAATDQQLVAVITAAVCALTGSSPDGFNIRSIKRMSRSNWK